MSQAVELAKKAERSGVLLKRGVINQRWKRRFFVFVSSTRRLYYFEDEVSKKMKSFISIQDSYVRLPKKSRSEGPLKNLFEVVTFDRIYYLVASSPEDLLGWVQSLSKYSSIMEENKLFLCVEDLIEHKAKEMNEIQSKIEKLEIQSPAAREEMATTQNYSNQYAWSPQESPPSVSPVREIHFRKSSAANLPKASFHSDSSSFQEERQLFRRTKSTIVVGVSTRSSPSIPAVSNQFGLGSLRKGEDSGKGNRRGKEMHSNGRSTQLQSTLQYSSLGSRAQLTPSPTWVHSTPIRGCTPPATTPEILQRKRSQPSLDLHHPRHNIPNPGKQQVEKVGGSFDPQLPLIDFALMEEEGEDFREQGISSPPQIVGLSERFPTSPSPVTSDSLDFSSQQSDDNFPSFLPEKHSPSSVPLS